MWCGTCNCQSTACNCRCATVLRDNGHTRLIYNYWQHTPAPACFLMPVNIRRGVVIEFSRIYYSSEHECKCSKHWAGYVIGRTMTTMVVRRTDTARTAVDTPIVLGSVCIITTPTIPAASSDGCTGADNRTDSIGERN